VLDQCRLVLARPGAGEGRRSNALRLITTSVMKGQAIRYFL
jgi:hypothetical protein